MKVKSECQVPDIFSSCCLLLLITFPVLPITEPCTCISHQREIKDADREVQSKFCLTITFYCRVICASFFQLSRFRAAKDAVRLFVQHTSFAGFMT